VPAVTAVLTSAKFWVTLAITTVISYASYAVFGKPKFKVGGVEDRTLTARSSIAPWQVIYGEARVGGTIVFAYNSGSNKEYLNLVIVLAGHEVDSIGTIYFDETAVTLDANGDATSATIYENHATVKKHLGSSTQTADSDLITAVGNSAIWGTDHRLRGRAYLYVKLKHNADIYPHGVPNISAVVKGKEVYDPRTASTAWSDNAALCVIDYLIDTTYGLGCTYADEIGDDEAKAAANVCDESVSLKGGGSESRYTCNGRFEVDEQPADVLASLLTAMGGTLANVNGKWRLYAAAYRTPTVSLDEDDLAGPITVTTKIPRRDRANSVKGVFVSPDHGYQPTDYPPVENATYVTEDNSESIPLEWDLAFTDSHSMAQRLAKIELEKRRQEITVEGDFQMTAAGLAVGDTVKLTFDRYSWDEKVFEIVESGIRSADADGEHPILVVPLVLRETASSVYSWTAASDEQDMGSPTDPDFGDATDVSAPTGVTATSSSSTAQTTQEGLVVPRIQIAWTAAADARVNGYQVQCQYR